VGSEYVPQVCVLAAEEVFSFGRCKKVTTTCTCVQVHTLYDVYIYREMALVELFSREDLFLSSQLQESDSLFLPLGSNVCVCVFCIDL
jgi:hypothetical protein